jgi:hypothetical protein
MEKFIVAYFPVHKVVRNVRYLGSDQFDRLD